MHTVETPLSPTKNPVLVNECARALQQLNADCRSLKVAAFATEDGFEIARFPVGSDDGQRLTSMASALQALTEAVANDRELDETEYTLIEADRGRVLVRRVPGQTFLMIAVFGNEERTGQAISVSRRIMAELGETLNGSAPFSR